MGILTEKDEYTGGIYQIETTDPVIGGEDGISNVQAKQLANRTNFLKNLLAKVVDGTQSIGKALKLATARKISLGGAVTGSASFDGSADITINTTLGEGQITINSIDGLSMALNNKVEKATTLVGYGITDANTKTEVSNAIAASLNSANNTAYEMEGNLKGQVVITSNTTLTAAMSGALILVTAAVTVTLPAVNSVRSGTVFNIKNIGTGTVTIAPNGNVSDVSRLTILPLETFSILSDGAGTYRFLNRSLDRASPLTDALTLSGLGLNENGVPTIRGYKANGHLLHKASLDLNNVTQNEKATYSQTTNTPLPSEFFYVDSVMYDDINYRTQRAVLLTNAKPVTYARNMYNGTFGAWYRFVTGDEVGIDLNWTNVLPVRSAGQNIVNSSSKAIEVSISAYNGGSLYVNGELVQSINIGNAAAMASFYTRVGIGKSYRFEPYSSIAVWREA